MRMRHMRSPTTDKHDSACNSMLHHRPRGSNGEVIRSVEPSPIQERLNVLAKEYQPRNAEVIGINSNDAKKYPDDDFRAMQIRAKEMGYVFPYLWDETQTVAKAYDAVCTPDLYLFENEALGHKVPDFKLRYHGRLDDNWKDPRSVKRRDLAFALDAVLAGLPVPAEQIPSMGCSIKWKT